MAGLWDDGGPYPFRQVGIQLNIPKTVALERCPQHLECTANRRKVAFSHTPAHREAWNSVRADIRPKQHARCRSGDCSALNSSG